MCCKPYPRVRPVVARPGPALDAELGDAVAGMRPEEQHGVSTALRRVCGRRRGHAAGGETRGR